MATKIKTLKLDKNWLHSLISRRPNNQAHHNFCSLDLARDVSHVQRAYASRYNLANIITETFHIMMKSEKINSETINSGNHPSSG